MVDEANPPRPLVSSHSRRSAASRSPHVSSLKRIILFPQVSSILSVNRNHCAVHVSARVPGHPHQQAGHIGGSPPFADIGVRHAPPPLGPVHHPPPHTACPTPL